MRPSRTRSKLRRRGALRFMPHVCALLQIKFGRELTARRRVLRQQQTARGHPRSSVMFAVDPEPERLAADTLRVCRVETEVHAPAIDFELRRISLAALGHL